MKTPYYIGPARHGKVRFPPTPEDPTVPPLPLMALLAVSIPAQPAGGSETFPLWPDKAPASYRDGAKDKPRLTVYKAPAEKANGAAVVVCPGGGYGHLALDHEGKQVAEFFNSLGVHAFVLEYRVTKDRPGPLAPAPKLDVMRAVRTVRAKATDYGIDAKKIGLMGFSAGGHLASTGGTHFDLGDPDAADPIDRASSRPDFLVLGYPVITMEIGVAHYGSRSNLIGLNPTPAVVDEYSNEKRVTKETPPTFLFQTDEDKAVPAENAIRFYLALRKAGVPAELHVYEKGGHGLGINPKTKTGADTWKDRLADWLVVRGVVKAK
jgi:acetyl esterase/lipase